MRGTTIPSTTTAQFSSTGSTTSATTLGILCEPLPSIANQLSSLPSSSSSSTTTTSTALVPSSTTGGNSNSVTGEQAVKLAQLIAKNLFNAISGFVKPLPSGNVPGSGSGDGWIEFGLVEGWYRNFENKLRTRGIGFLQQSD